MELIELVRRTPPGHRIELDLAAGDLEALARAYLDRKTELDVRDLQIEVREPVVAVRGVTALLGRDVGLAVEGVPAVADRRLQLDLRRIELNGAPAPKFAASEISAFLEQKLNSPKLLLDVEAVTVTDRSVRVIAYRKPPPGTPPT